MFSKTITLTSAIAVAAAICFAATGVRRKFMNKLGKVGVAVIATAFLIGSSTSWLVAQASAQIINPGDTVSAEFDYSAEFPGPYQGGTVQFGVGTPRFAADDIITIQSLE